MLAVQISENHLYVHVSTWRGPAYCTKLIFLQKMSYHVHITCLWSWPDCHIRRWQSYKQTANPVVAIQDCVSTFVSVTPLALQHLNSKVSCNITTSTTYPLFCWLHLVASALTQGWARTLTWDRVNVCVLYSQPSPQLLQLFQRMLQHCFAVRLQKSFTAHKTLSDFSSAWRWVDSDWSFFYFWVNSSVKNGSNKCQPVFSLLWHSPDRRSLTVKSGVFALARCNLSQAIKMICPLQPNMPLHSSKYL